MTKRQPEKPRVSPPQLMFLTQRFLAPFLLPRNLFIFAVVVDLWIPARNDSSASVRRHGFPHVICCPRICAYKVYLKNVTLITVPQVLVLRLGRRE